MREAARLELTSERVEARSQRPVERYGNVDHMTKEARVVGMQAQAEKIEVDTIQTKIKLTLEEKYPSTLPAV